MIATVYTVKERHQRANARLAAMSNFRLTQRGEHPANKILANPHITLYSLDFEQKMAMFVETPAEIDLSQASFLFQTQYDEAVRVWTVSFETLLQLAQSVELDGSRLISIYSVGRCGSTLASQLFAQVSGVVNLSEPAVLSQLVVARNTAIAPDDELIALLRASVCLLCKTPAETAWVLKGQSFVVELGDWLHELFPQAKNLFLYRHAESWLRSGLRAFGQPAAASEQEAWQMDRERRERMGPLVPLIAHYDPNEPLPHAGMLMLMWLRAMERYVALDEAGMEMLAIRYADWRSSPEKTAVSMLTYCHCLPEDLTAVYQTLNKDSQADTYLSRETLGQRQRVLSEEELAELNKHLQNHPFINDADFVVPNTLGNTDVS